WEYHSTLYNNQGGINEGWANVDTLKQFGADLVLDTAEFNACVDSNKHADRVSYNKNVATDHGVEGTPVFIIVDSDGTTERIEGPQSSATFAEVIDAMLSEPIEEAMAQEETMMELPEGAVDGLKIGSTALWVEISDNKVYVSNPEDGLIHIIDATTNKVVSTIQSMVGVTVLEVVEDKNKLYASVMEHAPIQVYDLTTGESLGEIDIGEPVVTQWSNADKNYGQREYVNIQTNAIGLKYNPNTELLYAVHSTVHHVNIIDTNTDQNLGDISVGRTPLLIEIDQERNIGYVTNVETNDVSVLDLESNQQIKILNTGFVPDQMVIDYDNNRLYVTHHASPHVSVIDLRTQEIEGKIDLDGPTHALALDTLNHILHVTYMPESGVTGPGSVGKVEFIDTSSNQIVGDFSIPDNPFVIDIDSKNQKLYASVIEDGMIFIVDLDEDSDYQKIVVQAEEIISEPESTTDGGGCLIATAAYGTELAPQIQFLREIRDNTVMSTSSGAAFMTGFNQLYYSFSPTIADMERENPMFQETIRVFITPMISTLSIMTLAEDGNEVEVLGLGISVIALNLGMYVAAPALVGFTVSKRLRK
nr:thioredoxin domain-containing protein [archaeon]